MGSIRGSGGGTRAGYASGRGAMGKEFCARKVFSLPSGKMTTIVDPYGAAYNPDTSSGEFHYKIMKEPSKD